MISRFLFIFISLISINLLVHSQTSVHCDYMIHNSAEGVSYEMSEKTIFTINQTRIVKNSDNPVKGKEKITYEINKSLYNEKNKLYVYDIKDSEDEKNYMLVIDAKQRLIRFFYNTADKLTLTTYTIKEVTNKE